MAKRVTISVDDWFYDGYFGAVKGNLSSFVRGWIVKGFDYETSGVDTRNAIIIRVEQENRELSQKVKKLEFELLKYSHRKKKMSDKSRQNMLITKGLIKSGYNADIS